MLIVFSSARRQVSEVNRETEPGLVVDLIHCNAGVPSLPKQEKNLDTGLFSIGIIMRFERQPDRRTLSFNAYGTEADWLAEGEQENDWTRVMTTDSTVLSVIRQGRVPTLKSARPAAFQLQLSHCTDRDLEFDDSCLRHEQCVGFWIDFHRSHSVGIVT